MVAEGSFKLRVRCKKGIGQRIEIIIIILWTIFSFGKQKKALHLNIKLYQIF